MSLGIKFVVYYYSNWLFPMTTDMQLLFEKKLTYLTSVMWNCLRWATLPQQRRLSSHSIWRHYTAMGQCRNFDFPLYNLLCFHRNNSKMPLIVFKLKPRILSNHTYPGSVPVLNILKLAIFFAKVWRNDLALHDDSSYCRYVAVRNCRKAERTPDCFRSLSNFKIKFSLVYLPVRSHWQNAVARYLPSMTRFSIIA